MNIPMRTETNNDTTGPGRARGRANAHRGLLWRIAIGMAFAFTAAQTVRAAGPETIALGESGHFTLLAGAAITSTGGGIVVHDAGVSPAAGSTIGLTDPQVNGIIYAVDSTGPSGSIQAASMLTVAQNDLTVAYNAAAGRTPVPTGPFLNPGFGNIGGLTLAPGLYKFTTECHIEGADLTLTGGPDDVWIFQVGTALIMGADGRKIILAGGARAGNIFWQVGTSAVIGTFAEFKGTIMADQSIVFDTSSVLEGRALARIGQITWNGRSAMQTNVVFEVRSEHGQPDPGVGQYTREFGAMSSNRVNAVETLIDTQYVSTGWTMTGLLPASGSSTNMSTVHTNDAVLTWGWSTNYLLDATANLNGSISGDTNGFYAAGSQATVTGVPDPGHRFSHWTGDFSGSSTAATQTVVLDQPRALQANFIRNSVTLEIVSAHGVANPPVGLYTHEAGSLLTNQVSALETLVDTQYVATGWTMAGNTPFLGSGTSMTMMHTNDAVLTWGWSTNYFLTLTADHGSITNATAGFKPAGWAYDLYPVPDEGYRFDRWEVDGLPAGTGMPVNILMSAPRDVVAIFAPLFIDVSTQIVWSVNWVFDPRKGFYLGALAITNPLNRGGKNLLAPFWFEVAHTEYHWLRFPSGVDAATGMEYVDLSPAILAKLPGIGNGDNTLNPGETVIVSGIELMGRRTTTGLLMAVWADPPGATPPAAGDLDTDHDGIPNAWELQHPTALNPSNPFDGALDLDGDGMTSGAEYIAGTDPGDRASLFTIRACAGAPGVEWIGRAGRTYTVWASPSLTGAYSLVAEGIVQDGPAVCTDNPTRPGNSGPAMFYRVEAKLITGETR